MFFKKVIGIDLGSHKSRVVIPQKGIVLEQPTIIAVDNQTQKLITVGIEAEEMSGKAPSNISIIKPIKNGVIANYKGTESFIKYLIQESFGRFTFVKPFVVLAVPSSITSVEKRALEEATINAGASDVFLFPVSYLSALGANLDIHKPLGNMVVNLGAGSTESAVLSFNGIVVSNSIKIGSSAINEALVNYFKKVYGVIIGENMSEIIKVRICSVIPVENQKSIEVRGRDASSGMPKSFTVQTNDLVDAIRPTVTEVILSVRKVLEMTPPELSSDIVDNGIMATGGGIYLDNLLNLMTKAFGIPVVIAENPELATAYGIQEVIENFDKYANKAKL
jgi:rod shape-determining protein MreB